MTTSASLARAVDDGKPAVFVRIIGWLTLSAMAAFFINNILDLGFGITRAVDGFGGLLPWIVYAAFAVGAVILVQWTAARSLRRDALIVSNFNTYLIRGCFFAVLYIGVVDAGIAWLRVERMLPTLFSEELASALLRSGYIGPNVHLPLALLGFITACFSRTLGFTWLALLIVMAELLIVISRFVFSYEQSLMGDLVRYWYAALFLFASAHTLLEEGHVRVDVVFAGLSGRGKGRVNAYGTLLLGMTTTAAIFLICLWSKQSIVNSPVINFEVSQTGTAGMYIKYQMAVFLLIFAITMQIQFVSYFFDAVADMRKEGGRREVAPISH